MFKAFVSNFVALLVLTATLFSSFTVPIQSDFNLDIPLVSLEFPVKQDFVLRLQAETLDENVRLIWPASAASIPVGWSRDTDFDDRFLQGADSNYFFPNEIIASSHMHQGISHLHAGDGHIHNATGQSVSPAGSFSKQSAPTANVLPASIHGHNTVTSPSATIVYDLNRSDSNSFVALPPHVTGIIIKPDDGSQSFPSGAMAFLNDTSIPTGFNVSDGNNSTVDVTGGKFVLGADTGNDGGTFGGSDSHLHDMGQHSHSSAHDHAVFNSGSATTAFSVFNQTNPTSRNLIHHMVSFDVNSLATDENASLMTDDLNNNPKFISWLAVQASSDLSAFEEIIVPFIGRADSIPSGWVQVQDFNRQIKAIVNSVDINVVGGDDLHDHEITFHMHEYSLGHNHDVGSDTVFSSALGESGFPIVSVVPPTGSHSHTWGVQTTMPTLQDSGNGLSATDKRYSRVEVIFIRKIVVVVDSCTYSGSGDFVVDCQDVCLIVSDVDLQGNRLVLINSGSFELNAILRRISGIDLPEAPDICIMRVYVFDAGGFDIE